MVEENSVECPFCGIVISKYKPETHTTTTRSGTASAFRTPDSPETQTPSNIPYFKIGLVVLGLILLGVLLKPKHVPETTMISFKTNETITLSCNTKEKCVIAYLAPW